MLLSAPRDGIFAKKTKKNVASNATFFVDKTPVFHTRQFGFGQKKPRNKICSLAKFLQNDEATKHQHKNQRVGRANNLAVEPVQQTTVAGKQFAKIFDVAKAL